MKFWLNLFTAVWQSLKHFFTLKEVQDKLKEIAEIAVVHAYLHYKASGREKKKIAIKKAVNCLDLPLVLKPFRGLIGLILNNRIDKEIEEAYKKWKLNSQKA